MLTNISWANYMAIVALLFILYYFFIGIKFYSHELRQFFSGKSKLPLSFSPSKAGLNEDEESTLQTKDTQTDLFISNEKYISSAEEIEDRFQ